MARSTGGRLRIGRRSARLCQTQGRCPIPPHILAVGRTLDWIERGLAEKFQTATLPPGADPNALPPQARSGIIGAACFGGGFIDRRLVDALPDLRVVVNFGAGYDRIDLAACRERGVAVAYLPGVTATCVADHAMALILSQARGIVPAQHFIASGQWLERRFPLMRRVSGRKLGVYGLGAIGLAVAKRAAGFDMPVGYHNRRPRTDGAHRYFASLRELAAWADVLLVSCPATPQTEKSVDAAVLEALGPVGLLVNVARGSIVDEEALVDALDRGAIAGAALDVLAVEPARPAAFIGRDNVVLTPHCAGGTLETWRDTFDRLVANLERYLATGEVLDPVPWPEEERPPAR
jgi:lactate dehydrogenase-like 2-hydroxyacid dehydrogenase